MKKVLITCILHFFILTAVFAGGTPEIPSDEEIKNNVVDQLAANDLIDAAEIQVDVELGEVTLTGNAATYAAWQEATEEAWSVKGVVNVDNRLEVAYDETGINDDYLSRHIRSLLNMSADVDVENLDVTVRDGVVIMNGEVDNFWEKVRAGNIASDVTGVVDVDNSLTVVQTDEILDEAIAEDVESALERKAVVNADNITVRVDNGIVTLDGEVSTWMGHNAAYEAASNTIGVTDVVDNLVVESGLMELPTEQELKLEVAEQLEWDSRVDETDISVLVDDRTVTLVGTVESYTKKRYAEADAWSVLGVRDVKNDLMVVVGEISALDDDYLKETAEDALASNAEITAEDIVVEANAGSVTLAGTVPTLWEKVRAEDVAGNLIGVVGVENELGVVPTEDILDETIAETIVSNIDRKAAVDVENVDVKVVDGVVTLSGTVSSIAARDAAYDSALFTYGVLEIKDELVIEGETSS
jgi:osmotically-inducible protein OsmY